MSEEKINPMEDLLDKIGGHQDTTNEANAADVGKTRTINRPSVDNLHYSSKVKQVVINMDTRTDYVQQQQQQVGQQDEPFPQAIFKSNKGDIEMVDGNEGKNVSVSEFPDQYNTNHDQKDYMPMLDRFQLKVGQNGQQILNSSPVDGQISLDDPQQQQLQQIPYSVGVVDGWVGDQNQGLDDGFGDHYDNDAPEGFQHHPDAQRGVNAEPGSHGADRNDQIEADIGDCIGATDTLFPEEVPSSDQAALADSAQNDKRFYTLMEIAEMEPNFDKQYYDSEKNAQNAHVILSPAEYRAKLYWLDQENRWKDIGTGRFRLLLSKDEEEHYIQVVSEDMEDTMPLDDVDKVIDSVMGPESGQSPNGSGHHMGGSNPSKQVFLHRCFVNCLHEFSRQGDTIITWSDDYKNEFALSFQEEKGAQNTWWSICFLKGIQISANLDEHAEAGGSSESNSITGSGVVLPTKENLTDLVSDLYSTDAYVRRNIAEAVLRQEENAQRVTNGSSELSDRDHSKLQTWRSLYLDKLQKIFNEVEQHYYKATKAMEDNEGDEHDRCIHIQQQVNHLHSLFQIFRNLLNLNQSELLEVLLNENYWRTTFGALEYDPEVFSPLGYKYGEGSQAGAHSPVGSQKISQQSLNASPNSMARSYGSYDHFDQNNHFGSLLAQEADFREFLDNKVKFKQAVDITDPQVTYSIHLSYKLQYLKDTAMARFIDENTSHTIMQLVSQLHNTILDYIFGDDFERIQAQLISQMRDNSNVEDKENALKFFLEICSLLKSTNLTN